MLKIAILEDEKNVLDELKSFVEQYALENQKAVKIYPFLSSVDFLSNMNQSFDIAFLDIEMPYHNGMEVAQKLRGIDNQVMIIFVTNMAQFALRGYEVEAYRFLVKPVHYVGISTLLCSAVKKIERLRQEYSIAIKTKSGLYRIPVSQIQYIEINGHRIQFHTKENIYDTWGNLKALESELEPYDFVKCNACYLVNLRYVSSVEGMQVRVGTDVLTISQSWKKPFMQKLTGFLGG